MAKQSSIQDANQILAKSHLPKFRAIPFLPWISWEMIVKIMYLKINQAMILRDLHIHWSLRRPKKVKNKRKWPLQKNLIVALPVWTPCFKCRLWTQRWLKQPTWTLCKKCWSKIRTVLCSLWCSNRSKLNKRLPLLQLCHLNVRPQISTPLPPHR